MAFSKSKARKVLGVWKAFVSPYPNPLREKAMMLHS